MKKIYLSLIAAKLLEIKKELTTFEPYCSGFHLDIMDNNFVPNLTFGADFVNEIVGFASKQLFVHLMIDNPREFIERLNMRSDDIISVQYASMDDPQSIMKAIRNKGLLTSIAINPDVPLEKIYPYIDTLDQVVIMSVKAGFSGQEFMPETVEKAKALIAYRQKHKLDFDIAMDGGINVGNIQSLAELGIDSFVVGSGVFDAPDPLATLKELQQLLD